MEPMSAVRPREAALTEALLRIVADRGLDQASVREVAAEAGVSIGTVQHYFPTKDAMLAGAFTEVVARIRGRLVSTDLGPDVRRNLSVVLAQLLPLDAKRAAEARIQVAFAARAAHAPELAAIQRDVLRDVHQALADAFVVAGNQRLSAAEATLSAQIALAAVDGLALHAVSAAGALPPRRLKAALERLLDALVLSRPGE